MKNRTLKVAIIIITIVYLIPLCLYMIRDALVKRGYAIMMWTQEDYANAAEFYMRKKYGEKFEANIGTHGYWLETVSPKAHPEWNVNIIVDIEDGMAYFHDNYVGYLKKAELDKYIYELVKPIYGECKVYTEPFGFYLDDSWNKDTDIVTYVSSASYTTNIFTYGDMNSKETEFEKVCNIFLNENLQSSIVNVVYVTKEDFEKFEERNGNRIYNTGKYYYFIYASYSGKEENEFSKIRIIEGEDDYGK